MNDRSCFLGVDQVILYGPFQVILVDHTKLQAMEKSSCLEFINQMFPAEASLSGVEPFLQKIHNEIRHVDATILAAVRQQKTEAMVHDLRDIKKLDFAKKNMTTAGTALHRLTMLGTGTETEEILLLKKLSDSCLVVDALEPSVREELVNNFCSGELTSYEQIYIGIELKILDEIEVLYNRISCRIQTNLEKWKIFPASWHVPYRLCIQLSKKTRDQVESILVNLKEKPDVEKFQNF